MKHLKKEYQTHQFIAYYKALMTNEILQYHSTLFESMNLQDSFGQALQKAIDNYSFELIMYLSLKTLVYDLNLFTNEHDYNYKEAYLKYTESLSTADGLEHFFSKYKELKKRIENELNLFLTFAHDFYLHYRNDEVRIKEKFKVQDSLSDIRFGQGDTHQGKKSVIRLNFGEQQTIYYKPSYYHTFDILQETLILLKNKGITTFDVPETIKREGYCWQQGIEYKESDRIEEVRDIYFQFGVLAFIAYYYSGTDLHLQNLIVNKNKLYLIDIETFFQAHLSTPNQTSITTILYEKLQDSPLSTGLFPCQFSKSNRPDLSGLCGTGGQRVEKGNYKLVNKNQGNMRLVRAHYQTEEGKNIPSLQGKRVDPKKFRANVIEGYKAAYQIFQENKHDINSFLTRYRGMKTRLLVRNTSDYGKFLMVSTNPKYMSDEKSRTELFYMFRKSINDNNFLELFINSEVKDLMNGDVPVFYKDLDNHFYDSRNTFLGKGLDASKRSFGKELSEENLNTHIEWITICLEKPQKKWEVKEQASLQFDFNSEFAYGKQDKNKILVQECERMVRKLRESAFETTSEISWLNIDISSHEQWVISPFDNSLYSGLVGNALLFLAVYKITENPEYLTLLNKTLNTIEKNRHLMIENDISAFLGKGALLFLYFNVWIVLHEQEYLDQSNDIIKEIEKSNLDQMNLDYLSGLAGTAIILCNIFRYHKQNEILPFIERIGDILVKQSIEVETKYVYWKSDLSQDEVLNGLSHGISGIAYALIKIWDITGKEEYRLKALKSIAFENTRFVDGNWIDLRNRENREKKNFPDPVYWCHGAPGIGMVRAKIYEMIKLPEIKNDLQKALFITEQKGALGSDCLCHGIFGNLELLNLIAEQFNNQDLKNKIMDYLIERIETKSNQWVSGIPQNTTSHNFMIGEAGMAYQLLRLADSKQIPSILMLDLFGR